MDNLTDLKFRVTTLCLKLEMVLQTVWGWLAVTLVSVYNFFLPEGYAFTLVLVMILLDAVFGLSVAVKQGNFALSKLGSITLFKISAYFAALVFTFMVEKLAHDQGFIGVKVAAGWAAICEFWSMSASILIIWPNAPFFRIMRRHLKGEIASKLGQSVDDILPDEKN